MTTKMKKLGKILDESSGALRTGKLVEAAEEDEPVAEADEEGGDELNIDDVLDSELPNFAQKLILLVKSWADSIAVELDDNELADAAMAIVTGLKSKQTLLKTAAKLVNRRGGSMAKGLKKEL